MLRVAVSVRVVRTVAGLLLVVAIEIVLVVLLLLAARALVE